MSNEEYRVSEVDGRGRATRTEYTGRDYRAAGAAEDRLLAAGKFTRVSKGRLTLSERTPQPKRRGR